jgi:hypothetical protein
MKKVEIFSLEKKKDDQRRAEMQMTALERWNLAFQLIELTRSFSPDKEFTPPLNDSIKWIELKLKDERVKGSR